MKATILILGVTVFLASCSREATNTQKAQIKKEQAVEGSQDNAILRSAKIYELILNDLKTTYTRTGGGGISSIQQKSTTTFLAQMPQEEQVDTILYEIKFDDSGSVSIIKKTSGGIITKSTSSYD